MADADRADCNALPKGFGDNPHFRFLMCFFHVMKHIRGRVKLLFSVAQARVLTEVYDLHFARSQANYLEMLRAVWRRWMIDPTLIPFVQYFNGQWITGHFNSWHVFVTASGFASTNNPAEMFNALLKRDYTLRRRLKMDTLLRELSACYQDQPSTTRAFEFAVCPAPTLARRVSEMVREQLLGVAEDQDIDSVRAGSCCILRVISLRAVVFRWHPNNGARQTSLCQPRWAPIMRGRKSRESLWTAGPWMCSASAVHATTVSRSGRAFTFCLRYESLGTSTAAEEKCSLAVGRESGARSLFFLTLDACRRLTLL
ncbi:hypothetical protein PR003_g1241 [Phytophthora rubi]|uniref:MULE transposase domain-containing protein n=1 Tax=Phytophthora rubi TaxID=129364 RepID=A0A6A3NQU2_9STRA|nr:hypothetical protein PR001_g4407 [Phytophthora rubi]KAE9358501.1 hypothetical protein PR003_g1241 [Phytophthora rubi]